MRVWHVLCVCLLAFTLWQGSTPAAASSQMAFSDDFSSFVASRYHTGGVVEWDGTGEWMTLIPPDLGDQHGRLYLRQLLPVSVFEVEFSLLVGEAGGADGLTFAFVRDCFYPNSHGGFLDFDGAPGYAIEFDTWQDGWDPASPHIALIGGEVANHLAVADASGITDNAWHHAHITFSLGAVLVTLDGEEVLNTVIPDFEPFLGYLGFTAATGGRSNRHCIDDLALRVRTHGMTCATSFESSLSPCVAFAAGHGAANTRRPAVTGDPSAHSGLYVVSCEVTRVGVTGLRLDLPTQCTPPAEVDVRVWAYVADRSASDSSTFLGFVFAPEDLSPSVDPSLALGWEVCGPAASKYRLAGETVAATDGLTAGSWHLVQVRYNRSANTLTLWVDGELVSERAAPLAAGRAPAYLVLGAYGASEAAHTRVLFDDMQVTLIGYAGPPAQDYPVALIEGPERVAESQTRTYDIGYGNGYPMLGMEEITETLPQSLWVGASLPSDYTFVSADPAPSRVANGVPVWELPLPAIGQAGFIQLTAQTPTGLAEVTEERIWTWATTDPDAGTTDPPAPPGATIPLDPVWGLPQDVLPQHIVLVPSPDLWVHKVGPRFASPGDTITYAVTVGNCGETAGEDIVVRDLMPAEMGGGDRILGNLAPLEPGDTWSGVTSGSLPWGVPGGTLLLNTAYIPTTAPEGSYTNNISEWTTTVQAARDPNRITVSPTGGTDRGERLTYTLECENTGAGTAYGVYATASLDRNLNNATLLVSDPDAISYDPVSRTLVWEVGTLGTGEGASTIFSVTVASNAKRARPVIGQATVYFPSVPEETPTNVIFNIVAGSFSDVPWNHWAVLPVELAFENGIVGGYPDGSYRPALNVDRGQMAVFISRALAGGEGNVPTGPPTASFTDVPTDHWAYKYVEYAKSEGIVGGYPDGSYRPTLTIDRGQMAVFMARAVAGGDSLVPTGPATASFSDVPTDHWAYKYVEHTVSRSVVSGYPDGKYHPEIGVTRDQMAVFVQRAFALPL